MQQATTQQYHYQRVHYTEVDSRFKDACFQMYRYCCGLLNLDLDEKHIPIHFISLDPDCQKPFHTDTEKVAGIADVPTSAIYISLHQSLEEALFTVAHELRHQAQYRTMGFTVGYPKILTPILESDADQFAAKACRTFTYNRY